MLAVRWAVGAGNGIGQQVLQRVLSDTCCNWVTQGSGQSETLSAAKRGGNGRASNVSEMSEYE